MPAQYAHLDGRRYVNADFVSKVRETFPATTKKIPLGYSTYTGWTGKDQVLFTEHAPLDDLAHLNGQLYEVTFDPSHPEAFEQDILGTVSHSTVEKRATSKDVPRRRMTAEASLDDLWGPTLESAQKRWAKQQRRNAFVGEVQKRSQKSQGTVDDWIAWEMPSAG